MHIPCEFYLYEWLHCQDMPSRRVPNPLRTGREAGPIIRGVEDARSSSSTITTAPPPYPAVLPWHPSHIPLFSQHLELAAAEAHARKRITQNGAKIATATAIELDEEGGFGCVNAPSTLSYY